VRIQADPSTDPVDYEFHHRVRIRFAETDAMGIVHHSRYLPLLEEARVAYLRRIGHPYTSIQAEGIEMAVLEAFVQYRLPLRFDDVVSIHVSLARIDRATFQMAYALTVDGEVRATAATAHGCITPDGRPTRLPGWFRALADRPIAKDIRIGTDVLAVTVSPAEGGRVAQIKAHGVDLLIGRGQGPDPDSPLAWGSYPMVPFAGRVRRGMFGFDGDEYLLPINFENHAIHGYGFDRPWSVTAQDASSVELELDLGRDPRWPFGGTARQRISVDAEAVVMELSVGDAAVAMPASLGWHPWFRKPERMTFEPEAMYRRDADGVTVDELVAVPAGPWDDCFVNHRPVHITIGDVELRLSSPCTDWVVFDMRAHATCIEPETAPPDAFSIRPRRLDAGDRLSATYRIELVS
jgi:aldose 1-epimerase